MVKLTEGPPLWTGVPPRHDVVGITFDPDHLVTIDLDEDAAERLTYPTEGSSFVRHG